MRPKILLPAQDVHIETPSGIDPIWYEKLSALYKALDAFIQNGGYSENIYTPVMTSAGGTAPTFTALPLTGRYIKVGRLVTVQISGNNTAGGTPGAGAQQLSVSFPLPVAAQSLGGRLTFGAFLNGATEGLAFGQFAAAATTAPLYQQSISGSKSNQVPLTGADFNNVTRSVSWVFTYPVD